MASARAIFDAARRSSLVGGNLARLSISWSIRPNSGQLGTNSPALVLMLPVAFIVYVVWKRARYFGNSAPLLIAGTCFVLGWASPHYPGLGFQLVAFPFFFVFVAGVFADLLETRQRTVVLASLVGLLSAYALLNVARLLQVAAFR